MVNNLSKTQLSKQKAVNVTIDRATGQIELNVSGKKTIPRATSDPITDALRKIEQMSPETRSLVGERNPLNCSECKSVNNLELNGGNRSNFESHTLKVETGQDFQRCKNCEVTTDGVNTTSDH